MRANNINVAGFGLTGYYYGGKGIGSTFQFLDGYSAAGKARDSDGGYVQAMYTLPTKTKAAVSWGGNYMDRAAGDATSLVDSNEMWDAMLIHPLTKHLNLVAEYSYQESQAGAVWTM